MKIEPTADIRTMAKSLFEIYQAYIDAGFNPEQSLTLVGVILTKSIDNG